MEKAEFACELTRFSKGSALNPTHQSIHKRTIFFAQRRKDAKGFSLRLCVFARNKFYCDLGMNLHGFLRVFWVHVEERLLSRRWPLG
jgi:hypothetical protein